MAEPSPAMKALTVVVAIVVIGCIMALVVALTWRLVQAILP
jgi:hypothetical protein